MRVCSAMVRTLWRWGGVATLVVAAVAAMLVLWFVGLLFLLKLLIVRPPAVVWVGWAAIAGGSLLLGVGLPLDGWLRNGPAQSRRRRWGTRLDLWLSVAGTGGLAGVCWDALRGRLTAPAAADIVPLAPLPAFFMGAAFTLLTLLFLPGVRPDHASPPRD